MGFMYRHSRFLFFLLMSLLLLGFSLSGFPQNQGKIQSPPSGYWYHGIYPGPEDMSGEEDRITLKSLEQYESAVGKKAAWVYFSHEWSQSEEFPLETVSWIHDHGSIPFIRLMLRYSSQQNIKEKFGEILMRHYMLGELLLITIDIP